MDFWKLGGHARNEKYQFEIKQEQHFISDRSGGFRLDVMKDAPLQENR
jgi:hypothetical protein